MPNLFRVQLSINTHCCHIDIAMKHPVPDRVKPSFVIFDIRALWRSVISVRVPSLSVRMPGHYVQSVWFTIKP